MLVPREFRRIVQYALVITLIVTLASPLLDVAAVSDLYPGAPAVASNPMDIAASVKTEPDPTAPELLRIDNGLAVNIVSGPSIGMDGLLWYQVDIAGLLGYIAESELTWGAVETPATDAAPVEEIILPAITGNGIVLSVDRSEIPCRITPDLQAESIFVYSNGSSIDLAGQPVDGWQPVLCAAQLGYLPVELVHDPADLPPPAPTEIVIEIEETPFVIEDEGVVDPPVIDDEIAASDASEEISEVPENEDDPEAIAPDLDVSPVAEETLPSAPETTTPEPIEDDTLPPETIATDEIVEDTPIAEDVIEEIEIPVVDADPNESVTPTASPPETPLPEITEVVMQTIDQTDTAVFPAAVGSTAVVYNTGAGGLRCRAGASLESPILMVLPLGTTVSVVGIANDGWQAVICNGQNGFMASRFLQSGGGSATGGTVGVITGSTGTVQGTGGDGLRCRSGTSLTASVITVLPEGTSVTSRGAVVGEWQPVTCAGSNGWVHIDFIGNTGSTGSSSQPGNSSGSSGTTTSTGSAVVANTEGTGVRFRASASLDSAIIAVLMEGTTVNLRNGSIGDWTAVTWNGRNGFIFAEFLATAKNPSLPPASGVGSTSLAAGSNARVTQAINFRGGASLTAEIIGTAAAGTVVRITGNPSNGFYPVKWVEYSGYMHGDYLVYTTEALSATGPNYATSDITGGGPGAGSGPGSAIGQKMVDYAMRYLGYPYIWATHGPNSFDCSGFTYWVVLNVTGRDISAGTWPQWNTGTPIAYGNLQPGDLVFFQNTDVIGLSHVGMYIGNDQFIHAENETTGVRISSLTSQYYASRYLGTRRMA